MKKLLILLATVFTLGFPGIVKADMTFLQIESIVYDSNLRFMPDSIVCCNDPMYLQLEEHLPEAIEAVNAVIAKDLTTKYIPHLFDCEDMANVAQATIIEEMANSLWASGIYAAVPVATVILSNVHTKVGVHMINLLIFQGKAILYDFGSNTAWSRMRLKLNGLAIQVIQF